MEMSNNLEKEFQNFMQLKLLSELTIIKEKIKLFQKKYNLKFNEFQKKVKEGEEKFDEWDDYLEWKAYEERAKELKGLIREYN